LDHLPAVGEPRAAVALHEPAPLVAVGVRLHDPHAGDDVRLLHLGHGGAGYRAPVRTRDSTRNSAASATPATTASAPPLPRRPAQTSQHRKRLRSSVSRPT